MQLILVLAESFQTLLLPILSSAKTMSSLTSAKPVIFIGAAGEMCRLAVERFAKASDNVTGFHGRSVIGSTQLGH
jgi:ABC-type uncharacterized transport system substrate-binding protein